MLCGASSIIPAEDFYPQYNLCANWRLITKLQQWQWVETGVTCNLYNNSKKILHTADTKSLGNANKKMNKIFFLWFFDLAKKIYKKFNNKKNSRGVVKIFKKTKCFVTLHATLHHEGLPSFIKLFQKLNLLWPNRIILDVALNINK